MPSEFYSEEVEYDKWRRNEGPRPIGCMESGLPHREGKCIDDYVEGSDGRRYREIDQRIEGNRIVEYGLRNGTWIFVQVIREITGGY